MSNRYHRSWTAVAAGLVPLACFTELGRAADDATASVLQEITVTAEKYSSTIQATPISVSALSGDQLTAEGITSVEEVAHEVPGLSMRTAGPGQTEYEARGLASSGGAAPTVGFYLDEVPVSPPALSQTGKIVIDPNLYDINRIEVLRGPQGTLYGSGSMGGTIKIVTNQPVLNQWQGSFQGTLSDTEGGSGNGGGNFMLNIPAGDVLALRLVGTYTYRSGWVDRIVLNPFPLDTPLTAPPPYLRGNVLAAPVEYDFHDVNTEYLYGGRASVLFQPSADLSVTANVLFQRISMGGYDEFDSPPGADYLAHYEAFNVPEPFRDWVHLYDLTINDNLGFADFVSATGYWQRYEGQTQDSSESSSVVVEIEPYVSLPYSEVDLTQQLSQEFRLVSRDDDQLHWVAGAFYSDLHSTWLSFGRNSYYAGPGNPSGWIFDSNNPYWTRQYALFADGSYKLTDALKLSAGLRWYRYLSQQFVSEWGFFAASPSPPAVPAETEASNNGYNPRVNLSYAPTRDLTYYVSASKGFRPGGANQGVPTFCGPSPTTFGPDSAWDYEVGEKARLLNDRLSINSDFYYIDWRGVQQVALLACAYQYDTNAGNGRSFGPELEIKAALSDHWSISLSGTYTDARITHPNANYINFLLTEVPGGVSSCETASNCVPPILNVPKETGNVALLYSRNLLDDYRLTARVSSDYVGRTTDEAFYYGIQLPGYSITNARLVMAHGSWSAALFVDNLTNKVAELTSNNTSFAFNIPGLIRYSTNQPRTFGTQVDFRF